MLMQPIFWIPESHVYNYCKRFFMHYLSRKRTGKLFMRSGQSLVSLAFFLFLFSLPAQGAWDWDYALPITAENYPRGPTGASKYSINTAYEVAQPVQLGQTMRVRVLIPPGTESAKISAQSNSWQCAPDITDGRGNIIVSQSERCPIMDGFDHDQGELCAYNPTNFNPSPCGEGTYIYPQNLHTVTARLLDILYPTESDSPDIIDVGKQRYAYFVLYQQPQALDKFSFTSNLGISFGISNVESYNEWVDAGRPPPIPSKTLIITPTPSGGTVTTQAGGINCGSGGNACSEKYETDMGQSAVLTATAQEGFSFVGWGGSCSGTTNPLTLSMDAGKTCSATFKRTYTLSITAPTNGTVTSDKGGINCGTNCSTIYTEGAEVTLTANPSKDFYFDSWGGHCSGTANPLTLTMGADNSCFATFKRTYTLTVKAEGKGTVLSFNAVGGPDSPIGGFDSRIICGTHVTNETLRVENCEAKYPQDTSVILVATQGTGAAFTGWAGDCSGTTNHVFLAMNGDKSCTATFGESTGGGSTVTDPKFDLNLGSSYGNLPLGNPDEFAGDTQIMVTVSVENSTDFFEPLTLDDEKVVEQGSSVDINATIIPESNHQIVDIVAVAALDAQEETRWDKLSELSWYQKTPSPNVFSDTGWKPWSPELSNPHIEAYGTRSGQARYSINVFTGQLPDNIEGIGSIKRVHLFVGYGLWVPSQGGFSYLVSQPVTLEIAPIQLTPGVQ
jgi:hypothetical protein